MEEKELSNFSLERKECPRCGAIWLNEKNVQDAELFG
jgi:ribosomal protein S27AE